jgi:vacuolar-type H+-ATPase subunit E/Vma4
MSVEAIIKQIQHDAEKEKKRIEKETQKKIDEITSTLKQETDEMKQGILEKGHQEIENIKRIEIAKAHQMEKRLILQAKEHLIDTCFEHALQHLKDLDGDSYSKMVETLITNGAKKINGDFTIKQSRPIDETIVKHHEITISGTVEASGGIILISKDHSRTIDNTFEGILKRKKQDIRVEVGSILFNEKS